MAAMAEAERDQREALHIDGDKADSHGSSDGDSHASQVSSAGLSMLQVAQGITTAVVGIGMFTLPYNVNKVGLIPVSLMLLWTGYMSYEGAVILSDAIRLWNKGNPTDKIRNFEDFGRAAFGQTGRVMVFVCMVIKLLLGCGGFILKTRKSLETLLGFDFDSRWYALGYMPVLLGLSMLKDLRALRMLSPVGVVSAVVSALGIVIQALVDTGKWKELDGREDTRDSMILWGLPEDMKILEFGGCMACVFYGFNNLVAVVPQNVAEMQDSSKLPMAAGVSTALISVLYISIVFSAHNAYGDFTRSDVLDNMKAFPSSWQGVQDAAVLDTTLGRKSDINDLLKVWPSQGGTPWIANIAAATTITNLLVTYPLLMIHLFGSLQGFEAVQRMCPFGSAANYAMRAGMVGITTGIGLIFQDLRDVGTLVGFLICPTLFVLIPLIFSWRIRSVCGAEPQSQVRWIVQGVAMAYCVATSIGGMSSFISDIVSRS